MPQRPDAHEPPLATFGASAEFEDRLARHGAQAQVIWLRFSKKGRGEPTLSRSDAVDAALAFGWVDGLVGPIDKAAYKTRFTPQAPRSRGSQVNCERVERLMAGGRRRPPGLRQVEAARADGRWAAAYPPASRAQAPADGMAALAERPAATARRIELRGSDRYAILHRRHRTAAARRVARIDAFAEQLEGGGGPNSGRSTKPPPA